jgi:Fe-S cluster biogenesis protein NfuA
MPDAREKVREVLATVVAPLVECDGAELYLVHVEGKEVVLHFGGTYAGCPGVGAVTRTIVRPVLCTVVPDVNVIANSGLPVPKGAERLTSNGKK